jgi:hypothetical protein
MIEITSRKIKIIIMLTGGFQFMRIRDFLPYILLVSLLLADIVVFFGIVKLFFNLDPAIIAGIIGFIGAILGGAITYIGVNKTLQHRDREIFMTSATEKLMINDNLINTYKVYLNTVFLLENSNMDIDIKKEKTVALVEKIIMLLNNDNEKIYKCMEYDAIRIIDFYKKSLSGSIMKRPITEDNMQNCIEKIRDIFNVIDVNKTQLEQNYYKYKNNN